MLSAPAPRRHNPRQSAKSLRTRGRRCVFARAESGKMAGAAWGGYSRCGCSGARACPPCCGASRMPSPGARPRRWSGRLAEEGGRSAGTRAARVSRRSLLGGTHQRRDELALAAGVRGNAIDAARGWRIRGCEARSGPPPARRGSAWRPLSSVLLKAMCVTAFFRVPSPQRATIWRAQENAVSGGCVPAANSNVAAPTRMQRMPLAAGASTRALLSVPGECSGCPLSSATPGRSQARRQQQAALGRRWP